MASLLRRLSIPFKDSSETPAQTEIDTTATQRRKSSLSVPVSERTLGARDYKLAVEQPELLARRASVTSDLAYEDSNTSQAIVDDTVKGRVYGARDYKMIPRKMSS